MNRITFQAKDWGKVSLHRPWGVPWRVASKYVNKLATFKLGFDFVRLSAGWRKRESVTRYRDKVFSRRVSDVQKMDTYPWMVRFGCSHV